jgi:hypothetical protein
MQVRRLLHEWGIGKPAGEHRIQLEGHLSSPMGRARSPIMPLQALNAGSFGTRALSGGEGRWPHAESEAQRAVHFVDLGRVTRSHQAFKAKAGDREDVVQVRDATNRQALAASKRNLRWQTADGSGDKDRDNPVDRVQHAISGQYNHRPVARRGRQVSPPNFSPSHFGSPASKSAG